MMPTPQQVLSLKRRLGYPVFTRPWDLNLVGLRAAERRAGAWDDLVGFVFTDDQGVLRAELYPATTDPGASFLERPKREAGTAILLPGHTPAAYTFGMHKGQYPALVQRVGIPYVRDDNLDDVLDIEALARRGPIFRDVIGANVHRSAEFGTVAEVGAYSAGCQVVQAPWHFAALLALAKIQQQRGLGSQFSYSLMS